MLSCSQFLRFGSWNVEGLSKKLSDSDFISIFEQFDFISLVETWLPRGDSAISVDGFCSFSKCRQMPNNARRNSGGVSVLVRSSLRKGVKFLDKDSCEDFIWYKLDKAFFNFERDVFVCTVYIPPQNSPRERRVEVDHFEVLQETLYKFSGLGEVMLCGDFNARMGNLDDFTEGYDLLTNVTYSLPFDRRNSRDDHVNAYGRTLVDLCCGNDLVVLNGRTKGDLFGQFTCHTYNGASVVDYVIVSHSLLPIVSNFSVSTITEYSHHCFLSFILKARILESSGSQLELGPHPAAFVWDDSVKDVLQDALCSDGVTNAMDSVFTSLTNGNIDIECTVCDFTKVLVDVTKKVMHVRKRKALKAKGPRKEIWFDKDCHILKKELRNAAKLLSKYPNDPFLRHGFFTKRKEYKKLTKKLKRKFHSDLLDKIKNVADSNPKEFWKLVNSIKSKRSGGSGEVSPEDWFTYFRDLNKQSFSSESTSSEARVVQDFKLWAVKSNDILDAPITLEEVCDLSGRLKNKKASAGDSVLNELIKMSVGILGRYFVKLFNLVLSRGVFPRGWSEGFIVPLHKSGDKTDPGNYRGICISSCLGKFFTLILNVRLNNFLVENDLLNQYQIGFRHGFRTSDHLLVLKTLIDFYKSKRLPLFACFVDFRKAYDSVWREGLFYKLITYGCSRNFIGILLSMYSSVRSAVKLDHGVTPFFHSSVGVKQGCNLSPTLFNLFINDIPSIFKSSCDPVRLGGSRLSCLLYADDLVLLSESESGLRECLRELKAYSRKWKLSVNLKKSKVLIFGTQSQRRIHTASRWLFGEDLIECVDEYTYLGLTFHFSGNFKLALKTLYTKALRAYHSLLRNMSNMENVPIKVLLKLFSSLVVPVLLYGCEIWGVFLLGRIPSFEVFQSKLFKVVNDIEKLQLKFFKHVLGVHRKATNLAVYGELGRVPLIVKVATLVAKFWFRIKDSSYDYSLVGLAAKVCFRSNLSPVIFTNYLLRICGFKSLHEVSVPRKQLHGLGRIIKERLCGLFSDNWKDQMRLSNGKLRTLSKIKINFGFERYLNEPNVKFRRAVTRLRVSAHRLPVEVGRFVKLPYEKRICPICPLNEVGDEFHLLMSCTNRNIEGIRNRFLEDLHKVNNTFTLFGPKELFLYMFSMQDISIMKIVLKYCNDVLASFLDCDVS